jgi:hypothetical protein
LVKIFASFVLKRKHEEHEEKNKGHGGTGRSLEQAMRIPDLAGSGVRQPDWSSSRWQAGQIAPRRQANLPSPFGATGGTLRA